MDANIGFSYCVSRALFSLQRKTFRKTVLFSLSSVGFLIRTLSWDSHVSRQDARGSCDLFTLSENVSQCSAEKQAPDETLSLAEVTTQLKSYLKTVSWD